MARNIGNENERRRLHAQKIFVCVKICKLWKYQLTLFGDIENLHQNRIKQKFNLFDIVARDNFEIQAF